MEWMHIIGNIALIVVLGSGVLMTLVGMPGNWLILGSGIVYAYLTDFLLIDYAVLVIAGGLFVLAELVEAVAGLWGAKREKASGQAMGAAWLGTIVGGLWGTALLPVIGSVAGALAGAFVGALLAEWRKRGDYEQAKRVAHGVVKGQLIGLSIKVIVAVSMAILFIYPLKWH